MKLFHCIKLGAKFSFASCESMRARPSWKEHEALRAKKKGRIPEPLFRPEHCDGCTDFEKPKFIKISLNTSNLPPQEITPPRNKPKDEIDSLLEVVLPKRRENHNPS